MSMVQQSGTLESIIGTHPSVVEVWKPFGLWKPFEPFPEPLPFQFHAKFWGKSRADEEQRWHNAQSLMPDGGHEPMGVGMSEEEDDVIDGCCFLELDDIKDLKISRIWIRAEYIRIYDAVESCCKKAFKRAPAAVITGQPGIGKSMWIYYALCRRLSERKPVIWYFKNTCYLFVDEGVYRVPDKFREFQTFVWTLVDSGTLDSDCFNEGVPEDLFMRFTRHFVIYCTSPSQERWRRLHKTVDRKIFIMNPWKIKEILRVVDMLPPTMKVDRDRAIDIFNQLGPIPRLCIDHLHDPTLIEQYEQNVKKIISALTISTLQELFRKSDSLSMDTYSFKICLISRRDREDVRSLAMVSSITSYIKSRLAAHFRTLEHREQIRLYKSFSKEWRKAADIFFEAAAQRCFQGGVNLEFIPMVRLASNTSGKPLWHSSHVVFPNDAELEHSRQQALQDRQLLIIPEGLDIVEYMKDGPSSPIMSNVIYVPESTNQVAHDSFIVMNDFLYIFQFTIDEEHKIETGVIDFVGRYPELPSMDNWRFIFILPPIHELLCLQPWKFEIQPYSAAIDLDDWY